MTYGSAAEFFAALEARADDSRARSLTGSYRFDIDGAGSWRVDIRDGEVAVAQSSDAADSVIKTDEQTFLAVLAGEQSPIGAFMTGKIRVEGDMGLALKLRELFG